MKYVQMEIFTAVELSWMRDPARRRNYSAGTVEFRRENEVRRAFGKALLHAGKLRRADPEARTPGGKVSWIETARAGFRAVNRKREQVAADRERDRRRLAGELFDWPSFASRWQRKYAGLQRAGARTRGLVALAA